MNVNIQGAPIYFEIPILGGIPITATLVVSWGVMLVLTLVCIWLTHDLKVRNISKRQAVAEKIVITAENFVRNNMGEAWMRYVPFVSTIFAMSIFSSLSSLVGLWPPTADVSTTLAWGIVVFVIIAIVFRSASVPVLLVAAIESAIMINLGIPYFTGTTLPFITSIVIGTIQLGATVDYAILMTTRFREERNAGHTAKEAAQIAVEQCSQSILTSGLTFFAATFSVSLVSRMELIGVLCKLISRGALISMAVILLVLPALLVITEPILRKTTFHWLKKPEITEKKA